jgi:hypothetical protein
MMSASLSLRVVAATILAAVTIVDPFADSVPAQTSQTCELRKSFFNRNRYVFGSVNAECSGDFMWCPPFSHSVPWGNWGVDSNVGSRRNSDQFAGWRDFGSLQWNSMYVRVPSTE